MSNTDQAPHLSSLSHCALLLGTCLDDSGYSAPGWASDHTSRMTAVVEVAAKWLFLEWPPSSQELKVWDQGTPR